MQHVTRLMVFKRENMDKVYQGKSKKSYTIIEPALASGGEGSIYLIREYKDIVLKIFKSDRRTREREEKLLKMVEYQLDSTQLKQITWPQDVVYDRSGFIGYAMPRLYENQNLNMVYSAQDNTLDLRHRMLIAYNLCAAIDTVHSFNQVCGDLNPQNICVNLDFTSKNALQVTLVDTDSYHITDEEKTYRCEVGLANYLAPEIQKKLTNGRDLKHAPLPTYTKETDLFAVAVHIFALIMNGCHPFACAKKINARYEHTMEAMDSTDYDSAVLPQPIENIKEGFFPFYQERRGITYPLYAPDFMALPMEVRNLFIRAFENGYYDPKERPTTGEWLRVLRKYQTSECFRQCEKKHYYFGTEGISCPYCAAKQRIIRMMSYDIPDSQNEPKSYTYHQQTTPHSNNVNQTISQSVFVKGKPRWWKIAISMLVVAACLGGTLLYNHSIEAYRNLNRNYVMDNIEIYIDLAESYAMDNNFEKAFSTIEEGKVNYGASDEDFSDVYNLLKNQCYDLARKCVENGEYAKAEDTLYVGTLKLPSDYCDILTDYLEMVGFLEEIDSYVQAEDYGSALYTFSCELKECQEETIWKCYERTFGKMIEYVENMISKMETGQYEEAFELLQRYEKQFGYCDLFYVDGKVYGRTYDSDDVLKGTGFILDSYQQYMYYGELDLGKQCGNGIEMGQYGDGYYYVSGEFWNDYANGECTLFYSKLQFSNGEKYKETIKGNFTNGYEDGTMTNKIIYLESGRKEKYKYTASMGTYKLLRQEDDSYVYMENEEGSVSVSSEEDLKNNGAPRRK